MWWGAPGHTEPLHIDVTDGTLCQLCGRKRVILFPRACWRALSPFPVNPHGMSWAFSRVRISCPDFQRFPGLRQAMAMRLELDLEEGDVLFIPSGVAHEITGMGSEHVLSVNRFWRTDPSPLLPHLPDDARLMMQSSQQVAGY